jgi:predicted nucleic acid-binding protein
MPAKAALSNKPQLESFEEPRDSFEVTVGRPQCRVGRVCGDRDLAPEARDAIAAMGITVAPLTATMAERAAELRARHRRLRLPDAIVLACARELQGELLSHDERLDRIANDPRE